MSLPFLQNYLGLSSGLQTTLGGVTPTFQDDYTTNSGWTQTGTTITVDSGVADKLAGVSVTNSSDQRVSKALGVTLSDSLWRCDCDFNMTTAPTTDGRGFPLFVSTGTAKYRDGSHDALAIRLLELSGAFRLGMSYNLAGTVTHFTDATTIAISTSTTYYLRFGRTSTTNARLSVFTDASRVTHQSGSPINFTIDAGVGTLVTLQHGSDDVSLAGWSATIDNTKIYNNMSP